MAALAGCSSQSKSTHLLPIVAVYLQNTDISIQRAALGCISKLKLCDFDQSVFERCTRLLSSDTKDFSAELLFLASEHEKLKYQPFLQMLILPILAGRVAYHGNQREKAVLKIMIKYICTWDNTLIGALLNALASHGRAALFVLETLIHKLFVFCNSYYIVYMCIVLFQQHVFKD
jgi:hypothetical protein